MVELRKRPAPKETAAPAPAAKRSASKARAPASAAAAKAAKPATKGKKEKESEEATSTATVDAASKATKPEPKTDTTTTTSSKSSSTKFPLSAESVNKSIPLSPLSSEITLHTSTTTTLPKLLSQSSKGIIIFSYPKASTPGCTTQACAFRDSFSDLKTAGFTVYGISGDSAKSNTTFVTKQNLNYDLICDTEGVLSGPLGLKKPGNAKGCVRGVVLLVKNGDGEDDAVVGVWFLGGPQKTLDACLDFVAK